MPPKKKAKVDGNELNEATSEEQVHDKAEKQKRGRKKATNADNNKTPKVLQNQAKTEYENQDFSNSSTTEDGKPWNLKIASWNVDGLRAWIKKGGLDYLKHEDPDIFCLQETKCSDSKLPEETQISNYHLYWSHSDTDGYAGLGLYSKVKPESVKNGIGNPEFDKEGRVIVAEYKTFYFINVYVPNAGRKLVTLPKRMEWDKEFLKFINDLNSKKPVVICGDMNVAHQEIDIANPKANKRNAGFTQEERDGFTNFLKTENLIDCFRYKNPDVKGAYTFWTYLANARKKNVGWRLDYCLISGKLKENFCDCVHRTEVYGSDHCPLVLFLHM